MPTDTSTTFEQAEETSSALSVLDFLYHDSRRIGSFLAQFEGDGHLQSLTRTKDGERGKKEASKAEGKGNLGVASGKLEATVETSLASSEGYARVFDPYWANARAFLNYLSDSDMLNRNVRHAEVGQFVLAKGYLNVLDLSVMKEAWKLPAIQRQILKSDSKPYSQMNATQKMAAKSAKETAEMTLGLLQTMPHFVQASLLTDNQDETAMVWGTLRDEYLVQPASEITLAHGKFMPGKWSIVGILTALPEYEEPDLSGNIDGENIGTMTSMVGAVSQALAPIMRYALGRPANAHAVTPLLIFREVL